MHALEERALHAAARVVVSYPKSVLCACALLSLAAVYAASNHVELVTGRNDLVSSDKTYVQLDEEYDDEFVGLDQVVVVVEPRDVRQGKAFLTRLAERLAQDRRHVADVFYRVDTSSLEGKKLLYLSADELGDIRRNLEDSEPIIRELLDQPGLNTLLEAINTQASSAVVSYLVDDFLGLGDDTDDETSEFSDSQLDFLNTLLHEMARALDDEPFRSPWATLFGGQGQLDDDGFLISDNRRYLFCMVKANEDAAAGFNELQDSVAAIRGTITELAVAFPGLSAGVTGTKALGNDEMLSAQHDTAVATLVSLTGIGLLYLLFFRRVRHPLCIVTALLIGLSWTLGFVALTVGHLTIITVFIAPMLLGLADDFGVHFMTRYEEERVKGKDPAAAIRVVFEKTVPSILAGACTTAVAFFAVVLADFRGVQELGIISGSGILLAVLAVLSFLPAVIVVSDAVRPWRVVAQDLPALHHGFTRFGGYVERYRGRVLALAGLAGVASLAAVPLVSFDYNLLNLQAHGTESVDWEKRIIENTERSSWNALATAATPEATRRKARAFTALPSVERVESVASLVPADQAERRAALTTLRPLVADLPSLEYRSQTVDIERLHVTLDKLRLKLREPSDGGPTGGGETRLHETRVRLLAVRDALVKLPADTAQPRLAGFERDLFDDFGTTWTLLRHNLSPAGPITLDDIPESLRRRFVSRDGQRFLLQIYPKHDIWDGAPLAEFVAELRSIDPDVTGSPVIGYESIGAMKDGYVEAAWYALLAILLVTYLALRRVGDTLLAVLPLGLGMLWTAGLMWLGDVQFNLANMVAAPLIIGIGIENGIHLVHRFRQRVEESAHGARRSGSAAELIAGSTGQAVVLFSLTTMVGFGSLMVARYYGIFSIGLLLSLAVGSVLVASIVVLPPLLHRDSKRGRPAVSRGPALARQDPAQGDIS